MIYLSRLSPPPVEYGRDYFFDQYKKQYGKTYLEDFPHLLAAAKARLRHIRALGPPERGGRLLDIGCAYGPFLAAAREEGYAPAGFDPAEDAVGYVRETLGIPAFRGLFPGEIPRELSVPGGFEVISLWYVAEHFEDLRRVLLEIGRLLKDGGVLALSTPSGSGVSARKSLRSFLEKSPEDHWTIWSPHYCRKLLKAYGFDLRKTVSTGHHPERFPLIGGFLSGGRGPLYGLFLGISRIFRLGDTFEAYAVKEPG
jgi:SAM-dependent methyltransferase